MDRDGRREDTHDRKRKEILEAALGVFAERGFDGITLEAVAEALGYTKQALYYYFRNKEDIIVALVLDFLREARERIGSIAAEEGPPRQRLRRFISFYVEQSLSRRGYFAIHQHLKSFIEHARDEASKAEIARMSAETPTLIIALIAEGVERGDFRQEEPQALGCIIFGMLSGVLMNLDMPALAAMDGEKLKETVCDIIVKGIEP